MPALRNQRHELYALGLAKGLTSDAAHTAAGYMPNRRNATRLKTNQDIINRVQELLSKNAERFVLSKQYVLDSLIDIIEISLGRRPVKIGADGVLTYVYRGDAANTAIKLAGLEVGLFIEKSEVTHRHQELDDLSDTELVRRLRDEADALLREREARMIDVTPEDG
jgi:hypothetical protein